MSKKREEQLKKQRKREREAAKQKKQHMQMLVLITVGILLLVVIGFVLYFAATGGGDKRDGDSGETTTNPVPFAYDQQPRLGQADAPVKIVEFGDFRCPSCKQYHEQFVPQLKEDFIDDGKAAYYFINLPILGEGSLRAALAAESIQERYPNSDVYWDYHEAIFANQDAENESWPTTEALVQLAEEHIPDIDTAQLKKDIEEQTYMDKVNDDMQKGQSAGVSGTPTVFVNGQLLDEDHTFQYSLLKEAVQEGYEEAEK